MYQATDGAGHILMLSGAGNRWPVGAGSAALLNKVSGHFPKFKDVF